MLSAGVLLAGWGLGDTSAAVEPEAWLEWTAPPECQNTSEIERRLQSLLGRPVDFADIPLTRVRMAWSADRGWAVRVTVALPSGARDRSLDAPSCADALDVVALSLALILDPDFVPAELPGEAAVASDAEVAPGESHLVGVVLDSEPEQGSEPPGAGSVTSAAQDQSVEAAEVGEDGSNGAIALGGGAKVDLTTFPVPQFGGGIQLGVRDGAFRIEAEGSLLASESASFPAAEQRVSFMSLVGGLRGCWAPSLSSRLAWAMCAGGELGSLSTKELGGTARRESGVWLASQIVTGPEFSATPWLRAFAHAKGVTALIRHDFLLSEGSRVHEFPWLGMQLEVGFSMDVTELGDEGH